MRNVARKFNRSEKFLISLGLPQTIDTLDGDKAHQRIGDFNLVFGQSVRSVERLSSIRSSLQSHW